MAVVRLTNRAAGRAVRRLIGSLEHKIRVERVTMFGSRARDWHLLDSDVDLMIVSPDFEGMDIRDRQALVWEHWDQDVMLDAVCLTRAELKQKAGQLGVVAEILKQGREIPLGRRSGSDG